MTPIPIACLLSESEKAQRGADLSQTLFDAVQETRELADGYAFRFAHERRWLDALVEFAASERECCPFLLFDIRCGPGLAPDLVGGWRPSG
ncbi:MAG: hypothetical protein HYR71_05235 [Chloroflexi bacterium]|nr:hypothetical protein [Chloroflexota bacterium]